jgi:hypothetical protein
MSEQLQLDLGVTRPVGRPAGGIFTPRQFAASARLTPEEARAYLVDFAAEGVVERCPGGWRLTAKGRHVGRDLLRWTGGGE